MQFPYTEVGAGILRPLVPVRITGPVGIVFEDGLLDAGADRTLITRKVATQLGIDVESLVTTIQIQSATGQLVHCKLARLTFELRRDTRRISWSAEVGVALQSIQRPLWGYKGFLEYFRATFDGPRRLVTLTAGKNLPKTKRRD